MLEHEVEDTVVRKAEIAGWVVRKVQWQGRRGAPDHAFFGFGRLVLIEFKRPGECIDMTSQQGREFKRLKKRYAEVYECNSVAEGLRILGIENGKR